jgi:hypothetical protein
MHALIAFAQTEFPPLVNLLAMLPVCAQSQTGSNLESTDIL